MKKKSIFIWQFRKNAYLCTANEKVVVSTTYDIVLWCNGSTTDSGPVCPSSNLGRTTKSFLIQEAFFVSVCSGCGQVFRKVVKS